MFAIELAKRYGDEGVVSTAIHPGMIRSELGHHMSVVVQWSVVSGVIFAIGASFQFNNCLL